MLVTSLERASSSEGLVTVSAYSIMLEQWITLDRRMAASAQTEVEWWVVLVIQFLFLRLYNDITIPDSKYVSSQVHCTTFIRVICENVRYIILLLFIGDTSFVCAKDMPRG